MELIDRDDERSLFDDIVSEKGAIRVLAICAGAKRGKTSLLEYFEHESQQTFGIPAGRVEMTNLKDRSAFGVAEHLVQVLRDFDLPFPRFDFLTAALAEEDFSAFRSQRPVNSADVRTGGATVSGGLVANQVGEVYQVNEGGSQTIVQAPAAWTGKQEEIARAQCADAFVDDLGDVTPTQRVLLLVDAWEDCPESLAGWIERRLLLKHALSDGPTGLTVIVAGRTIPNLTKGRTDLVRRLDALSTWHDHHIEKYLELRGVVPDDISVAQVRKGLHELNWTFEDLKSFVQLLKPRP